MAGSPDDLDHSLCLDQGVFLKGLTVFIRLQMESYVLLPQDLPAKRAEDLLHFPELIGIIAGQDSSLHTSSPRISFCFCWST